MTREYSLKKFFRALFFMYFVLIFFESHVASQYGLTVNGTNCSMFNLTKCDFCGPGTVYNSSKFLVLVKQMVNMKTKASTSYWS